eukprot:Nk52_evm28s2118 gene=Nk52_evmTU28s2118
MVERVLVTGATGFIASHIVKKLLEQGKYQVRGTEKVKPLQELVSYPKYPLELVEADLLQDKGWEEAVSDCDYVLHTATPILAAAKPEDAEETQFKPAVNGTMRVLRACAVNYSKVKRVVLTSSIAAVSTGHTSASGREYSEKDWANTDAIMKFGYAHAKTEAERAGWNFVEEIKKTGSGKHPFELVTINPSFVFGKLAGSVGVTVDVIQSIFAGKYPFTVKMAFPTVDVEDVADAHIRGMEVPEAAGRRFILFAETLWMSEIADILREKFSNMGYNSMPSTPLPWLVCWTLSWFKKELAYPLDKWGIKNTYDNEPSRTILGIKYKPVSQCIIETVHSLIENGKIEKTAQYKP